MNCTTLTLKTAAGQAACNKDHVRNRAIIARMTARSTVKPREGWQSGVNRVCRRCNSGVKMKRGIRDHVRAVPATGRSRRSETNW